MLTLGSEINAIPAEKLSQISPVVGLLSHNLSRWELQICCSCFFFHTRQMEHGAVNELYGVYRTAWLGDFDLAFVINVRTCTVKRKEKEKR